MITVHYQEAFYSLSDVYSSRAYFSVLGSAMARPVRNFVLEGVFIILSVCCFIVGGVHIFPTLEQKLEAVIKEEAGQVIL